MDASAFELIERKRRFRKQTLEIAKRRILKGERAADLAAAYGVHPARIYAIEMLIAAAWEELKLPEGWEEVTLIAPKALIKEFQRRAADSHQKLARRKFSK